MQINQPKSINMLYSTQQNFGEIKNKPPPPSNLNILSFQSRQVPSEKTVHSKLMNKRPIRKDDNQVCKSRGYLIQVLLRRTFIMPNYQALKMSKEAFLARKQETQTILDKNQNDHCYQNRGNQQQYQEYRSTSPNNNRTRSILTVINKASGLAIRNKRGYDFSNNKSNNHQNQKQEYKQIRISNVIPRVLKSGGGEISLLNSTNMGNRFISNDSQTSQNNQGNNQGAHNKSGVSSQFQLEVKFNADTPQNGQKIFTPYQEYYQNNLGENGNPDILHSLYSLENLRDSNEYIQIRKNSLPSQVTLGNDQSLIESPNMHGDSSVDNTNKAQPQIDVFKMHIYKQEESNVLDTLRISQDYVSMKMSNFETFNKKNTVTNPTPLFNGPPSQEIQTDFNNDEFAEVQIYAVDQTSSEHLISKRGDQSEGRLTNSTIFNNLDKQGKEFLNILLYIDNSQNITSDDIKEINKNNQYDLDISFLKKVDHLTKANLNLSKSNQGSFLRNSYSHLNPMIVTVENKNKGNNDLIIQPEEIVYEDHAPPFEKISLSKLLNQSKDLFKQQVKLEQDQKVLQEAQRIAMQQQQEEDRDKKGNKAASNKKLDSIKFKHFKQLLLSQIYPQEFLVAILLNDYDKFKKSYNVLKKINVSKEVKKIKSQMISNNTIYSNANKSPSPFRNTQLSLQNQKIVGNETSKNFFTGPSINDTSEIQYKRDIQNANWKHQLKHIYKNENENSNKSHNVTSKKHKPPLFQKLNNLTTQNIKVDTKKRRELKSLLLSFMEDQSSKDTHTTDKNYQNFKSKNRSYSPDKFNNNTITLGEDISRIFDNNHSYSGLIRIDEEKEGKSQRNDYSINNILGKYSDANGNDVISKKKLLLENIILNRMNAQQQQSSGSYQNLKPKINYNTYTQLDKLNRQIRKSKELHFSEKKKYIDVNLKIGTPYVLT
ncbi:UNKNOWN [Stylonychia lemnae]|uniref:Uncharacterized protein n=1 Tax=Stylonychia lemnae TaxID=5949 RepID=A0A078AE49_STYLE|nr:UNKNOWN [Stylonychia lemnae]|eukprot:CDW80529.1 UNKNOWN [Stylonychia lemnae]